MEVKTMLGTKAELKKTRFYQEIQEETLAQFLPMLLRSGMSIQEIAKEAKIPVKQVKAIAQSIGIEL
jgi:predicted transposase YdaD